MNNKTILTTFIEEAFNLGNTGVINELVHPDYRYTSPTDQLNGPSELAAFVSAFRETFPDLRVDITDQVEDEETVCTRLTVKGTQLGSFLDIPPTGRSIEIEGVVISRFKNGLIHDEWELLDHYKFLTQLGVIGSPA
jgi:steroid delta-isomerase-like uncharacterized protein